MVRPRQPIRLSRRKRLSANFDSVRRPFAANLTCLSFREGRASRVDAAVAGGRAAVRGRGGWTMRSGTASPAGHAKFIPTFADRLLVARPTATCTSTRYRRFLPKCQITFRRSHFAQLFSPFQRLFFLNLNRPTIPPTVVTAVFPLFIIYYIGQARSSPNVITIRATVSLDPFPF